MAVILLLPGAGSPRTEEAERLAAEAVRLAEDQPEAGLSQARKALALTSDFEPTAFVKAGRKGEVVEDAYLEGRREFRRHRARLYGALGECLARAGRHEQAVRYLRRALDLGGGDPNAGARLSRSLLALGRGRTALDTLLAGGAARLGPEALALAEQAADAIGLASLQAEIDRARLQALGVVPRVEYRDGPFRLPDGARLPTGAPLRFDGDGMALAYVAEASCRSCSADLEALTRVVPKGVRVVVTPALPDHDQVLRQTLGLYGYDWPLLVAKGIAASLGVSPPSVLVVARHGWVGAVSRPPLETTVPPVVEVLGRMDVRETVPRPAWNRRPASRPPAAEGPGLLPEGLAPGEDDPPPADFAEAVAAYRTGRAAKALRLLESIEARGDGWLLPPEARLDRALCLAALGRRDEARRLLLRTGDSRFQEAVDRALESVGTPPVRSK